MRTLLDALIVLIGATVAVVTIVGLVSPPDYDGEPGERLRPVVGGVVEAGEVEDGRRYVLFEHRDETGDVTELDAPELHDLLVRNDIELTGSLMQGVRSKAFLAVRVEGGKQFRATERPESAWQSLLFLLGGLGLAGYGASSLYRTFAT